MVPQDRGRTNRTLLATGLLSRVRVSVRPRFFYTRKQSNPRGNRAASASVVFQWPVTSHCRQRSGPSLLGATDPSNSDNLNDGDGGVCVCVCVHAFSRVRTHACACVRACVCACVRACVRACVMCLQYTIIIFDPG